jgi:hypothetical protein
MELNTGYAVLTAPGPPTPLIDSSSPHQLTRNLNWTRCNMAWQAHLVVLVVMIVVLQHFLKLLQRVSW